MMQRLLVLFVGALSLSAHATDARAVEPARAECRPLARAPRPSTGRRGPVFLYEERRSGLPGCYRCGLASADFDGDGLEDIVMAGSFDSAFTSGMGSYTFNDRVRLFRNVSCPGAEIRFRLVEELERVAGGGGAQVVTGDFDGDGRTDFAVQFREGDAPASDTSAFLNRSGWRFERAPLARGFDANSTSLGMAAGDIDGDGLDDLAFNSDGYGAGPGLWYRYDPSAGRFRAQQTDFPHRIAYGGTIAVGDLDGNGLPDLVVGGNSTEPFGDYDCTSTVLYGEIHFNRGGQIARAGETLSRYALRVDRDRPPVCTGMDNAAVELADVDADGNLDVIIAGSAESFSGPPGSGGSQYDFVVLHNVDGTGKNFVTFENPGPEYPNGSTNGGSGNMDGDSIAVGDLTGDGLAEVFIQGHRRDHGGDASRYVFESKLFFNTGNRTFTELELGLPDVGEGGQVIADFNADGKLDLIYAGATIPFHSNGTNSDDQNDASSLRAVVYRNVRP